MGVPKIANAIEIQDMAVGVGGWCWSCIIESETRKEYVVS
jgi:hypothetical protein